MNVCKVQSWIASSLVALALVVGGIWVWMTSGAEAVKPAAATSLDSFSGYVYDGNVDEETTPLSGVTVDSYDLALRTQGADLQISKSGPAGPLPPGAQINYTVMITNTGPADAPNVIVSDVLPADVSYLSCSPA